MADTTETTLTTANTTFHDLQIFAFGFLIYIYYYQNDDGAFGFSIVQDAQ